MTKFNQHILIAAENEEGKRKKKDSLGEVFELMKSLTELQKQIEECLESQEDVDARSKIQAFDKHIDDMYHTLLDLASTGVHAIRKRNNMPEEVPPVEDAPAEEPVVEKAPVEKSPLPSVASPLAPKPIR